MSETVLQYKLQVTVLTEDEGGIHETLHTFWLSPVLFGGVKDVVATVESDVPGRPHPSYHKFRFFIPTFAESGPMWVDEFYHPDDPAFTALLDVVLPTLQLWDDAQPCRLRYDYLPSVPV